MTIRSGADPSSSLYKKIKCKMNIMNATCVVTSSLQRLGEGLPRNVVSSHAEVMAKGASHGPWLCFIISGIKP
jgi:hypothetical protein